MCKNKILKKSFLLMLSSLFVRCIEHNASLKNYPDVNSLAQERLFLLKYPLVHSNV